MMDSNVENLLIMEVLAATVPMMDFVMPDIANADNDGY
jgi:hypothetical protein